MIERKPRESLTIRQAKQNANNYFKFEEVYEGVHYLTFCKYFTTFIYYSQLTPQ